MDVKATLETRLSQKGNPYEVVVIKLSDNSDKLVFLTPAELELLKIYDKNKTSEKKPSFLK